MARRCGSQGTAPTSGQTGSSRPRPADARLPPGGRSRPAPPSPAAISSLGGRTSARSHLGARRRACGRGLGPVRSRGSWVQPGSLACLHAVSTVSAVQFRGWVSVRGARCSVYEVFEAGAPTSVFRCACPRPYWSPVWGRWPGCLGGSPPFWLPPVSCALRLRSVPRPRPSICCIFPNLRSSLCDGSCSFIKENRFRECLAPAAGPASCNRGHRSSRSAVPRGPSTRSSCSIRSWLGCRLWGLRQPFQIGNLGGDRSQKVINKHWVAVRLARDP